MPDPKALRAADTRRAIREYLAGRRLLAFNIKDLTLGLNRDKHLTATFNPDGPEWTEREIETEAEFLVGVAHIKVATDPLGSRKSYQITPAGVLAHERGE
ncbi:MAG: hypothetical protein HZA88_16560 [Verrucomicrobia bacterium]|nr:hypothetical protein [Verrucomicrobiota bacterium]